MLGLDCFESQPCKDLNAPLFYALLPIGKKDPFFSNYKQVYVHIDKYLIQWKLITVLIRLSKPVKIKRTIYKVNQKSMNVLIPKMNAKYVIQSCGRHALLIGSNPISFNMYSELMSGRFQPKIAERNTFQ